MFGSVSSQHMYAKRISLIVLIYYLKTGQETPVKPPVSPNANSSALSLKPFIIFPLLTSNMLSTTL
ncbi:hypothetical protein HanIR_Chr03g0143761 [Helianthus annuus]|nr:hypothetical protein HanIR_Chr03g0143761 [Helianthus annuus]